MDLRFNATSDFTGSLSTQAFFQSKDDWILAARNTTEGIVRHGSQTPYAWIFVEEPKSGVIVTESQSIPENAVVIGVDAQGNRLYVARTFYQDGVYVGEVGRSKAGATIVHGGRVVEINPYEILVKATTTKHFYDFSPPTCYLTDKFSRKLKEIKPVVLLDDSDSTDGKPWESVKQAVLDVAWMLREYEGAGLDLHLLNDTATILRNQKDERSIEEKFEVIAPEGSTAIGKRLEDLYFEYLSNLTARSSPVSIIIITDGAPSPSDVSLAEVIIKIAKSLDERRLHRFKVGVQIVQIGDNRLVSDTLKYLDDGIAKENRVRDIVDTVLYNPHFQKGKQDYLEMMAKILMGAMFNSLDQDQTEVDPLPL